MGITYSIIVAIDQEQGIGKDNGIPWHFSEDLQNFKRLTINNVVIMGRKTWDSLPARFKPLDHRSNIIITRDPISFLDQLDIPQEQLPDVKIVDSFEAALKEATRFNKQKKIFVIGGASIFELALNRSECNELIVTEIKQSFNCDTFFPEFRDQWQFDETLLSTEDFQINIYKRSI